MRTSALTLCLLATFASTPIVAADRTELTLYRSNDASLFGASDGAVPSGYAVVREPRSLHLETGLQDIQLGGLPTYLDPEALALQVDGDAATVVSQRLQLAQGETSLLGGLIGQTVEVLGSNGTVLANGVLVSTDGALQLRQAGQTLLIHDYAAVRVNRKVDGGARLDLRVDAKHATTANAHLSYVTGGLGWRASYVGTLAPGAQCRLQLQSRASVANRSGSDWHDAMLTLIAGEPRFGKSSAPPVTMAASFRGKMAEVALPEQSSLADYRSFRLPHPVDLPDGSVSLLPLYAPRTIDCERTELYESGGSYRPQHPLIDPGFAPRGNDAIVSTLAFTAFDSLPAGYLRVLAQDDRGTEQFIGEGRIGDTPKKGAVQLVLGNAFDLHAKRERTSFRVDKAGRTLDEAFRITLSNAGETSRTVTVREHPNRWRQWTLASSSIKPVSRSQDTLVFKIAVPAEGKVELDYAVHYTWSADDQPQ